MKFSRHVYPSPRVAALGCTLATLSCVAQTEDDMVSEWQGAAAHLVLTGTLEGETLDVNLSGAEAQDPMKLYCELEWEGPPLTPDGLEPDLSMVSLGRIKILAEIQVGGETRWVSLEHKEEDFQAAGAGKSFNVVPPSETEEAGPGDMLFEFEYTDALDGEETLEAFPNSGSFELELFEGVQMASSVVFEDGSASVGGFLDVSFSASERLTLSYSAPCLVLEVDVE